MSNMIETLDELRTRILALDLSEQSEFALIRLVDAAETEWNCRTPSSEVADTIRRSLVASESINDTDAWYKRMNTALKWLDAQPQE